MIHAALLSILLLCADARASNLHAYLTYVGPAEQGQSRVQVEITDASLAAVLGEQPAAGRFRAVVTNGDARVMGARRLAGSGASLYTVLAFDRSGSFRSHWDDAFVLAGAFADSMPGDGSVIVTIMTFHSDQTFHGTAASPAELRTLLAEVEALGTLGSSSETSLMSAVRAGAKHAAERQSAGGARQLIVFSDAGEEGAVFQLAETTAYVRQLGTPVHPVVLKQVASPGSSSSQRFATANDRMKKLAEDSGGQHLHTITADADAKARLAAHATAAQRLYWLDVRYCDVSSTSARFPDLLYIDVIEGATVQAHTDDAGFTQHASGDALQPCTALPVPPSTASSDHGVAPDGTQTDDPDGTDPIDILHSERGWLLPVMGAALLLLLLLGAIALALLFGRRKRPHPTPAPVAVPVAAPEPSALPEPAVEPQATAGVAAPQDLSPSWQDPLAQPLPETRLVILSGGDGMEGFYRIHKREFVLGADGNRGVDLVFSVAQVSGRHATIQLYASGAAYLTDHSTNGTFVDGQRLSKGERRQLQPGQVIGLSSRVLLRLEQPGLTPEHVPPPAPPPAPAPAPAPTPASSRSKNKTLYGPIDGPPPAPAAAPAEEPSTRRVRSRTIIQPLRRDEDS